jgi:hypothetical protein
MQVASAKQSSKEEKWTVADLPGKLRKQAGDMTIWALGWVDQINDAGIASLFGYATILFFILRISYW